MNASRQIDTVRQALEDNSGRLVRRLWADPGAAGTLRDALKDARCGEIYESMMRHLRLMESSLPVLAIAGLLNAGKSTVAAGFLSPTGRSRVLRGLRSDDATQRFVLWCPRSWESNEEKRQSLIEILGSVFGAKLEPLSEEPAEARRQYNYRDGDGGSFQLPLVGFDEGLDAAQFAILDCPDVERKYPGAEGTKTSHRRLEVLQKASSIASALLVVANHGKTEEEDMDTVLRSILAEMPGIPWWLLLNLCRTSYEPHQVIAQVAALAAAHEARGVYVAYDFDHEESPWRRWTPEPLHQLRTPEEANRLPAFYLAVGEPAGNPPHSVDESRFLERLPAQLSSEGGIGMHMMTIHARKFCEQVDAAHSQLQAYCGNRKVVVTGLCESLLCVCTKGYLDDRGDLVVPLTPETADRFRRAFVRSAPMHCRVALFCNTPLLKLKQLSQRTWKKFIEERFPKKEDAAEIVQAVTAKRFADEMVREGFAAGAITSQDERIATWNEILARQAQFHPEQLDEEELVEALREVWKARGAGTRVKEVVTPLAMVSLIFLALSLGPAASPALVALLHHLGMSATFVLQAGTFLTHTVVAHVSVSQLLAGFGVAASAPAGGFAIEKLMRTRLSLPALSDLFACACDVFGLPRGAGEGLWAEIGDGGYPLPPSNADRGPVCHDLLGGSVWEVQPKGWRELKGLAEQLLAAHPRS